MENKDIWITKENLELVFSSFLERDYSRLTNLIILIRESAGILIKAPKDGWDIEKDSSDEIVIEDDGFIN